MRKTIIAMTAAAIAVLPALAGANEDALIAADKAFSEKSVQEGPLAAFKAYAAPNARMFSGEGTMLKGEEAIAAMTKDTYGEGKDAALSWTPTEAVASADGTMGSTSGDWVFTTPAGPDGKTMTIKGIYFTVWAKQADGSFKYTYDGGEAVKAPAAK